ncbi:hypothetical protein HGG64_01575 [Mycoplasma phocoeninasale]|uniref:Lipoprotein n=1 Tax=Mycoplasma phocoeninasale TaxID=2726117 RepID=A0A858U4R1_9MOLU|nr:hypothetical protein [Mycoplasma phocoeninasale]QJG66397.1 hypothetical protein HGG64_01575 [Mycoplasma phocoeninasale]
MKNKKIKWLITLPFAIFAFPLVAASCNNTSSKDIKFEKDFNKINYSTEILYANLEIISETEIYELGVLGKLKEYPYIEEAKKLIKKLIIVEPQNKESLENGLLFFSDFKNYLDDKPGALDFSLAFQN